MNPRHRALEVLCLSDPSEKALAAQALYATLDVTTLNTTEDLAAQLARTDPAGTTVPGRPARPQLLQAMQIRSRSPYTVEGRGALLHAIAHIEFNAINLALDAAFRFAHMPVAFYADWLRVASEEALHFSLLRTHLQTLGFDYGDFDAHDGLWLMTQRTAGDVLARMALVPRTLEARGLDATPPLQAKFAKAGDARAVEILEVILRDEVGHVAIGNHWYRWLCEREGLDPVAHYPALLVRYAAPKPRPPFNMAAREAAGFTADELAYLNGDGVSD
jgi:uncharacterized ferritin-like protein (DUF455 family)